MILIDSRERDDIDAEVRRLGIEASVTTLEFGDCTFSAIDGRTVGCERKKLSDLVNSMRDRRLSGKQLRGMWETYDFIFLFTEGEWRPGPNGEIEERAAQWSPQMKKKVWGWYPFYKKGNVGDRAAVSYEQVLGYLTGLELRGNVVWRHTRDTAETAAQYVALYRNFQKPWDKHHSHDQLYCGDVPIKGHSNGWADPHTHEEDYRRNGRGTVMISQAPPTTLWRMAAQLPGVDRKAEAVAKAFGTVQAMANATETEWIAVDGIGKKTAQAAIRAITEVGG